LDGGGEDLRRSLIGSICARAAASSLFTAAPHSGTSGPAALIRAQHTRGYSRGCTRHTHRAYARVMTTRRGTPSGACSRSRPLAFSRVTLEERYYARSGWRARGLAMTALSANCAKNETFVRAGEREGEEE